MTQKEFIELLDRYYNGTCSAKERNLVERWCDSILSNEQKTVVYSLEDKDKMFKVITASRKKVIAIDHRHSKANKVALAAVAAVFIVALSATLYFVSLRKHVEASLSVSPLKLTDVPIYNHTSQSISVSLSDGSKVLLSPKSKLTSVAFTKTERILKLEGKAFFKVARDANRPFLVFTNQLITKVLGTSFTINATKGIEESVEVKTGKVSVYQGKTVKINSHQLPASYVTITPNQNVHFDTAQHRLVKSLVAHPALIQSNEANFIENPQLNPFSFDEAGSSSAFKMTFERTPVIEIFKTLEVSYGVEIKYDKSKISNCILTVSMDGEDLFTRLQVVCNAINGKYYVDETNVVIDSPGCL